MSTSDLPIIVTRADPGASETLQRLDALGYAALPAPTLFLAAKPDTPLPAPHASSGLVFTSANGVRAFAERRDDRRLPAWCVGPATADAAMRAGFLTIHESAGNAVDLAHFIAAQSVPKAQPLLHVANAAAAGNLKRELAALGFGVEFAPLYEMRPATELPQAVLDLIDDRSPAIMLVHSAKGASAFADLLQHTSPKRWGLVAISEQASAPLVHIAADRTFIAETPNEDGMFRALAGAVATLSA